MVSGEVFVVVRTFDGIGHNIRINYRNERCSSPNDTPPCFQLNNTEKVDRSKAYVYTEQSMSSQLIDSHAKSETNANDHIDDKSATQVTSADVPIANTVFISDKLFIDQNEFTSIEQAMTVNDLSTPIENTMSVDER
jgi:hypothetical protein